MNESSLEYSFRFSICISDKGKIKVRQFANDGKHMQPLRCMTPGERSSLTAPGQKGIFSQLGYERFWS